MQRFGKPSGRGASSRRSTPGWRRAAEALREADVEAAVAEAGEVMEKYPDDQRGASCLVLARLADGLPSHVVIGVATIPLRVVTVWRPDLHPELWADDFMSRRRSR